MSAPSTSTFSFTFPITPVSLSTAKTRRVSLAQESSPRLVQAWNFRDDTSLEARASEIASGSDLASEKKGKMRRVAMDDGELGIEKKVRKKWTKEETDMLVQGCNKVCVSPTSALWLLSLRGFNVYLLCFPQWGVGNWKSILNDETLTFDNRSPVDLKDRRVSFIFSPQEYRKHTSNTRLTIDFVPISPMLTESTIPTRRRIFPPRFAHPIPMVPPSSPRREARSGGPSPPRRTPLSKPATTSTAPSGHRLSRIPSSLSRTAARRTYVIAFEMRSLSCTKQRGINRVRRLLNAAEQ